MIRPASRSTATGHSTENARRAGPASPLDPRGTVGGAVPHVWPDRQARARSVLTCQVFTSALANRACCHRWIVLLATWDNFSRKMIAETWDLTEL